MELCRVVQNQKELETKVESRTIALLQTIEKQIENDNTTVPFRKSSINIRSILATYHIGGCALALVKLLSVICIDGINLNFERASYRIAPTVTSQIIKVCEEVFLGAMKSDIVAAVKSMNNHSFFKNKLYSITNSIKND